MRRILIMILAVLILGAQSFAADLSKAVIYDLTEDQMVKHFGKVIESQLSAADLSEITSYRFGADTIGVVAIMVDWDDRPGTYSAESFDSLLFSRDIYPGGSLADYYYEVSYGNLVVVGEVVGWYNGGMYSTLYNFPSILPTVDPDVDFSQFDYNGDSLIDAVIFIRSGYGEEDSQNPGDIWSYATGYSYGSGPGPFDGNIYLGRWNTSPELFPTRDPSIPWFFSGDTVLNNPRVFIHELGHNLGLPDLYDYDAKLSAGAFSYPNDDNDHPVYDWDVMGYYGYGILSIGSKVASHMCGWSRKEMDWITPIELVGTFSDLVINSIETTDVNSLFKIPLNPGEGEYFLLEYRNPRAPGKFDHFDSDFSVYFWPDLSYGADSLDRGLLITHIHDSLTTAGYRMNDGTPTYPHYSVTVEDAGYNPYRDATTNPGGIVSDSAEWWYPYESRKAALFTSEVLFKEVFAANSSPNSDSYFGPSGVVVVVDSIVGEQLYAFVYNPNTDEDGDGWGLMFDNCPDTYNPDQTDANNDGLGDACDACCIGIRGNVNSDPEDKVNIADLTFLVDRLFGIPLGPVPLCPEEANINGDIEEAINISDVTYLVAYLFGLPAGAAPPACP